MRPLSLALSILQNQLGAVPRPSWCTYLVTYRCNARCQMCDSWRIKPGDELSVDQADEVFAKIGRLDVVRLTGGEPFLREDLIEIAKVAHGQSRPRVLHITTNGSFPDRIVSFVERFPKPDLLRFMVSFDGLAGEHDANRGHDVRFETAMDSVRRLVRLRESHGIEVSANHTVISKASMDDSVELRRLLEGLGVDVHSVLAYADSAMYGAKLRGKRAEHLIVPTGYPLHPRLKEADVTGFVDRELAASRNLSSPLLRHGKRYYLRGLRSRLKQHPKPTPKPRCVALRSHLRLLPDGSVPICQFNTETVGNLARQPFDEIWHSAASQSARRWVDACPGCWAECEVMPSALYSGDIFFA